MTTKEFYILLTRLAGVTRDWERIEVYAVIHNPRTGEVQIATHICIPHLACVVKSASDELAARLTAKEGKEQEAVEEALQELLLRSMPPHGQGN